MIARDKLENALYALNAVLVLARSMAATGQPGTMIADVLDTAEYLPRLIWDRNDQTDCFREHLVSLAEKYPQFSLAVSRFDDPIPVAW